MTTCALYPRILIADDQPELLEALRLLLKERGMEMETVTSPDAVLRSIENGTFDLLLMDLNYTQNTTSGREGIDLLQRVRERDGLLPIVVMTGWGSVDLAVESMRRGVQDFVEKPWDNEQLVKTLRTQIDTGRARREAHAHDTREREETRLIQRRMLPSSLPESDGCEISVAWQPAAGVGGDCFDVIAFSRSRLAISIADAAGKGIPAALLMSNLQAAVRAYATETATAAEVCQQVNRILCGNTADGRFISFFYGALDTELCALTFANAGHYPPILVHSDGSVERLSGGGPVLGVLADVVYVQRQLPFRSGDRLVLFTDGITEARPRPRQPGHEPAADGHAEDEFGEERLIRLAVSNRTCSAPVLQARLFDAVSKYAGNLFHDDATLIVVAAH
jgi:phosphoserine phosphatase RsbU/P